MMNTSSSRSHTVLTLMVEQRILAGQGGAGGGGGAGKEGVSRTLRGKLLFVDLAGSERIRRTTSNGTRLTEAKAINTSLSALGNVIAALADSKASHSECARACVCVCVCVCERGREGTNLFLRLLLPQFRSETQSSRGCCRWEGKSRWEQ